MNTANSLKEFIDQIKKYWNEIFGLSLVPFDLAKSDKLNVIRNLLVFSTEKNICYTEMFPGLTLTLIKLIEKYQDNLPENHLKYLEILKNLHEEAKKEGKIYGTINFKGICKDELDIKIENEIFQNAGKIFSYNFEHPPFHLI